MKEPILQSLVGVKPSDVRQFIYNHGPDMADRSMDLQEVL
jgi:hypothetical protein